MRFRRSKKGTFDGPFQRAARWLLDKGVHPNHVTFAQLPVFGLEIWAAWQGYKWLFVSTILLIMLLDGGDGILARVGDLQSKQGAILDSSFDTLGIAIIMWSAAQFFPAYEAWFLWFFLGNSLIYLQNAVLGEKMISYVRGPVIAAIAWPDFLWGALALAAFCIAWIFLMRLPRTVRGLAHLDD